MSTPFNLPELDEDQLDQLSAEALTSGEFEQAMQTGWEENAGAAKPLVQFFNTISSPDMTAGLYQGPWNGITNLSNALGDLIQGKDIDVSDNYLKMSDEFARAVNPSRMFSGSHVLESDKSGLVLGGGVGAEIGGFGILSNIKRIGYLKTIADAAMKTQTAQKVLKAAATSDKVKRNLQRGQFASEFMGGALLATPFIDNNDGTLSDMVDDILFDGKNVIPFTTNEDMNYLDKTGMAVGSEGFLLPLTLLFGAVGAKKLLKPVADWSAGLKNGAQFMDEMSSVDLDRYLPPGAKGGEIVPYDSAIERAISDANDISHVEKQRARLVDMNLLEAGEGGQYEFVLDGAVNPQTKAEFDLIRKKRGELIRQGAETGEDVSSQLDELENLENMLKEELLAGNPVEMPERVIPPEQLTIPDPRPELDSFLAQLDELDDAQLRAIKRQVDLPAIRAERQAFLKQKATEIEELKKLIEEIPNKGYTEKGAARVLNTKNKALKELELELANLQQTRNTETLVGEQIELAIRGDLSVDESVGINYTWLGAKGKELQRMGDALNEFIESGQLDTWEPPPLPKIQDPNAIPTRSVSPEDLLEDGLVTGEFKPGRQDIPFNPDGLPSIEEYKEWLTSLSRETLRTLAAPTKSRVIDNIVRTNSGRRSRSAKKADIVEAFVEYFERTGRFVTAGPADDVIGADGVSDAVREAMFPDSLFKRQALPPQKPTVQSELDLPFTPTTSEMIRVVDAEGVESLVPAVAYKRRGIGFMEREKIKQIILENAIRNGEVQPPFTPLPERPRTEFNQPDFIEQLMTDETGQLNLLFSRGEAPLYKAGGKNAGALIEEMRLRWNYTELDGETRLAQKKAMDAELGIDKMSWQEKQKMGLLSESFYSLKSADLADNLPVKKSIKEATPPKKTEKKRWTREGIVDEKTAKRMDKEAPPPGKKEGNAGERRLNKQQQKDVSLEIDSTLRELEELDKLDGGIC